MAIADLFRPKHKHSKSEVRAAAVAAMSKEDVDLLVEVAKSDRDTSIRKSAIAKIADPDALKQVAESQDDGQLRAYASRLAVDIWVAKAISTDDVAVAKESFNHAATHGGDRALAEIAGNAQIAEVRTQALSRLADERALAQVVRKSQRAEDWQEALSRISDLSILRGIAIDEQRKEVAVAALDRIDDPAMLDEVVAKAKSKPVRNRAKRSRAAFAKLQVVSSPSSDRDKRERAERAQLVRHLERLAGGDEWVDSRVKADDASTRWRELGDGDDADLARRFHKALARYNNNNEMYGAAAREAVAKAARAAEASSPAPTSPPHTDTPIEVASEVPPEVVQASTDEVQVSVPAAPSPKQVAEEDKRFDNQDDLERLCEELEELAVSKIMKGFDRALKDSDKRRRGIGPLPANTAEALRERYDEARRKAVIHLGELREADDWKRWAAVPKMEALVVRAKALLEDQENKRIGESLKSLQKEWKELGPSPREKGDELWKVFKATCDEVYERVKAQRESRNEEQKENQVKKEALCERADELKTSTDWEATSAIFKEMQTEWKSIGPVQRRKADALWNRFRSACDEFFAARAPHLEDALSELSENLEAKQALIREIEELVASEGAVEEQISAVREIQRRWRDIGNVARQEFEALGEAYKAACDAVYAKREAAADAQREAQIAVIKTLEEQIVTCADAGWDSDAGEIAKTVLEVRATYQALEPSIDGYEELGAKVASLIRSQLESEPGAYKGTALDPERSKEAREKLIAKGKAWAPEELNTSSASPEDIAAKLRGALADRALGGVLSKTGGRTPEELVAELRGEWATIAPLPGASGAALLEQFEAVCTGILGPSHADPE